MAVKHDSMQAEMMLEEPRVVNLDSKDARPGDEASIEDHMGFIKFGSRVDLYLPLGTETLVNIGDKTTGGITEVARLHPTANNA